MKRGKHGNKSGDHVGASQTSEAKQEEGVEVFCLQQVLQLAQLYNMTSGSLQRLVPSFWFCTYPAEVGSQQLIVISEGIENER